MSLLVWIVVGAIAGFLANKITGSSASLIKMVGLGIVGGVAGGYVAMNLLKVGSVDGINVESLIIATLGAVAIVVLANLIGGARAARLGAA